VYLCKWQSSDVAVKCLNPTLFTPDGGMGSVGQEVVADLMREANMLSNLRHPNVVWVYGLVLPAEAVDLAEARANLSPGQAIDAVNVATTAANT
jgi:serine/threonine protein kinase